jgi:hypothetical protein
MWFFLAALTAILAFVGSPTFAADQWPLVFTIINKTNLPVVAIQAKPSTAQSFGNLFTKETGIDEDGQVHIPVGGSKDLHFRQQYGSDPASCTYDFYIKLTKNPSDSLDYDFIWPRNLDICGVDRVILLGTSRGELSQLSYRTEKDQPESAPAPVAQNSPVPPVPEITLPPPVTASPPRTAQTNPPPAPQPRPTSAGPTPSTRDIDPPTAYALTGSETASDTAEAMRSAGLDGIFSTECEKSLRFGNSARVYSIANMTLTAMGGDFVDGRQTFRIVAAKYVSNQNGDDITVRVQNTSNTTYPPYTQIFQIIRLPDTSGFRIVWTVSGKVTGAPYLKHCSADVNPLVEPTAAALAAAKEECLQLGAEQIERERALYLNQRQDDAFSRWAWLQVVNRTIDSQQEELKAECNANPSIRIEGPPPGLR